MANQNIGFEVTRSISPRIGVSDPIEGNGVASDLDLAGAIGVANAESNSTRGFNVNFGNGQDKVEGTATATSDTGEASANGVFNVGNIRLSGGADFLHGSATATTKNNGATTIATGINSTNGGSLRGGRNRDLVRGEATATGQDSVGAFAVLTTDLKTGGGNDIIEGTSIAEGISSTDARGISVGFSGIDDDTIANPENADRSPTASNEAEVGEILTGGGNDVLEGNSYVNVEAEDGDEIFFAGANGIAIDGGTLRQLETLLNTLGKDLTNFNSEDIEQIIGLLEISTLNTGDSNDRLIADVVLNVSQNGSGADEDLEVIGDGIENAGDVSLGNGNDSINSTVSVTTTISGAKGLADALDNSSVGIITGLGLEANNETLFDLGAGNDSFTSDIFATAVDDLSAADGMSNRGVFVAGAGNDNFNLTARSKFVLQNENDLEQQEGIADGWENRNVVFLDDREGVFAGNDSVTANATALGEGVLTIAEGLETRKFFDAGGGDDSFNLSGSATTGVGALADNLTQAAGLQTEQSQSGEFVLGEGNNSVVGNAVAKSEAIAGTDDGGERFTPSTFAFGITQMTADGNNAKDAGSLTAGTGNDTLNGTSDATGKRDVAAFGLLFSNANLGNGVNSLKGNATATSKVSALANGIAIGTNDVFVKNNSVVDRDRINEKSGLVAEAGVLSTGADRDSIEAVATANANGNTLVDSDANGISVEVNSILNTKAGADMIKAQATANSNGTTTNPESEFAVLADGIENQGTLTTGSGDDSLTAEGFTLGNGGTAIANGIDNRGFLNTGEDNDRITAKATTETVGGLASAKAIEQNEQADSQIALGSGNDTIVAEAIAESDDEIEAIALSGGTIKAGDGADNIRARSNDNLVSQDSFGNNFELNGGRGFGAEVEIALGAGDDTLFGFGNAIADGGIGIDTLQFEFDLVEFVSGGGSIDRFGNFTFGGVTYKTSNFEQFQFNTDFATNKITEIAIDDSLPNLFTSIEDLVNAVELIQTGNSGEIDSSSDNSGSDVISGTNNDDVLVGDDGNNVLRGSGGNDRINGGIGDDTLFGGGGMDSFVLSIGGGTDFVSDYADGRDKFILSNGLELDDLEFVQNTDSTQIKLVESNEILATLNSVTADLLERNDFSFEN